MNYSHFLFTQLFYALFPNELEYDKIFPIIEQLYSDYENSEYNVDTKGEYECMADFLQIQSIDFEKL